MKRILLLVLIVSACSKVDPPRKEAIRFGMYPVYSFSFHIPNQPLDYYYDTYYDTMYVSITETSLEVFRMDDTVLRSLQRFEVEFDRMVPQSFKKDSIRYQLISSYRKGYTHVVWEGFREDIQKTERFQIYYTEK